MTGQLCSSHFNLATETNLGLHGFSHGRTMWSLDLAILNTWWDHHPIFKGWEVTNVGNTNQTIDEQMSETPTKPSMTYPAPVFVG